MTTVLPVSLILDKRIEAKLGEQGFLSWWIQNDGSETIGSVRLQPQVQSVAEGIKLTSVSGGDFSTNPSGRQCLEMPFVVQHAGSYSLRIKVELWTESGVQHVLTSVGSVALQVSEPDRSGKLHITATAGIFKGQLPPGDVSIDLTGVGIFKFDGTAHTTGLGLTARVNHEFPEEDFQLELELGRPQVPGSFPPVDLQEYTKYWKSSGRRLMREMAFVDGFGSVRHQSAKDGDVYRLRLGSYQGGFITLVMRGTARVFRQLLPHRHQGELVITSSKALLFPRDLLSAVQGPLGEWEKIDDSPPFHGKGIEEVLAFVSQVHLLQPAAIFQGDDEPPNEMPVRKVGQLLQDAVAATNVELGYVRIEVV